MNTLEKKSVQPDETGRFWEARVSEALNIPRKTLAKLRTENLREETDFVRVENNAVVLTASGLSKIEDLLAGLPVARETTGKHPPFVAAEDVPPGPPRREVMTVERIPQNTRLLLCIPEKNPVLTALRVRDNTTFEPGMKIEAMQSGDGVWQFRNRHPGEESTVGRLPRTKGRW